MYLCTVYGSQNKQRLFRYAALTDWFYNGYDVFTARYELNIFV
jgi:hypothetical protein